MRWKWIAGICVAVTLALFVTAYIIISTYDFNALKPMVTKAVRDATGRDLTLGGDIKLHFGLTPSLVVEDVKFQNASWESLPDLATVKRLEVQVALLPLITGTIRIRRFTAVEPDILIETAKSGRSNLQFRPPGEPAENMRKGKNRRSQSKKRDFLKKQPKASLILLKSCSEGNHTHTLWPNI